MPASADRDGCLCLHMRNCAEIEGWQVPSVFWTNLKQEGNVKRVPWQTTWVLLKGRNSFLMWQYLSSYLVFKTLISFIRSSRPEVFCKKGIFRNFAKFTTLLKNRLWHRCFPVNSGKFQGRPFSIEHLWWLLLIYLLWIFRISRTRTVKRKNTNIS